MIELFYETNFTLDERDKIIDWINDIVLANQFEISQINYIFCDDSYLLDLNKKYLNHDYYTDILSFDDSMDKLIGGDIYISVERVFENAKDEQVLFADEIKRVMIHGVLHFMGYKDKTEQESQEMRKQEENCLKLYAK